MHLKLTNCTSKQLVSIKKALEKLNSPQMQILSIAGDPQGDEESFVEIVILSGCVSVKEANMCETKRFFRREERWHYWSDHAGYANSTAGELDVLTIGEHFETTYNDNSFCPLYDIYKVLLQNGFGRVQNFDIDVHFRDESIEK